MTVSVLVLTLNEEKNLDFCLKSLSWCDDVVVLDSFSTDKTLEIAARHGARVVQRVFDDWSSHQNWALENIQFKHRWVYYSDADEVLESELAEELIRISKSSTHFVAFRVRYKNYFRGQWIAHCGIYPVWVLRFFIPSAVRWERLVNPVPVVKGDVGTLEGHFAHFSFRKGLYAWFEKHNKYSSQEAIETMKARRFTTIDWRGIISKSPARRRTALKGLSFRLPFRPLFRFIYMYVFRLGFLDGAAGFHYCALLSIYEYMIVLKVAETNEDEVLV